MFFKCKLSLQHNMYTNNTRRCAVFKVADLSDESNHGQRLVRHGGVEQFLQRQFLAPDGAI